MQAEENYSNGCVQSAKELYSKAITCAKLHRFLNDEALVSNGNVIKLHNALIISSKLFSLTPYTMQAYELAARFYLEIGNQALSLEHFRLAHETYIAWGAIGKANSLFEYTNRTFSNILSHKLLGCRRER
jgi:hypothetical protein